MNIYSAWAITTKNHLVIVEQCRKLISTHQFNNEPMRILLASLASGLRPTDSFIVSTLQKHLLRELKTNDIAVKNPEQLKWAPASRRYALSTKAGADDAVDEDDDDIADDSNPIHEKVNAPRIITKHNPVTVAIYGQICMAAKSYQSAICTFVPSLHMRSGDTHRCSLPSSCIRLFSGRPCHLSELGNCVCGSRNAKAS